ncbi:MAG: hypothetical protein J0L53_16575 [Spirochaetes bacterium]|nr:hypothetical protein [Spirochaetota bacterium]MBX3723631.1 hypothetical protein [Turneriella sp.]
MRYVRLRGGEDFPFAERIAAAATATVAVFDAALLIAAADVWRLLGLAERNAVVVVDSFRARRNPAEALFSYLMRSARLALKKFLYPQGSLQGRAFAVNKPLLAAAAGSFREKKTYADFLQSLHVPDANIIIGESFAVAGNSTNALLGTGGATVNALRAWHRDKIFPRWFSGRFLLFHVAQLAVYYGALVAFISPRASLIVFLFAALITPQFFFTNLPWRNLQRVPAILGARFLLYFAG